MKDEHFWSLATWGKSVDQVSSVTPGFVDKEGHTFKTQKLE